MNCSPIQTQLKEVGRSEKELKEVAVVVTCYGATHDDAPHLKGWASISTISIVFNVSASIVLSTWYYADYWLQGWSRTRQASPRRLSHGQARVRPRRTSAGNDCWFKWRHKDKTNKETNKVKIKLASVEKCKTPRSLILDLSNADAMLSNEVLVPIQRDKKPAKI